MADITEEIVSRIEHDLHAGPSFVNVFKPWATQENAMFLLAVVKYKRNPTWDSLLSIHLKHIREGSTLQTNLPAPVSGAIDRYVKQWGDSKNAFKSAGVNLHIGVVDRDIFNAAFREIVGLINSQMNSKPAVQKFLEEFGLVPVGAR